MAAIPEASLAQVPLPPSLKVVLRPWQIVLIPEIKPGTGFTVTEDVVIHPVPSL
jgi:uncharacterized protein (DUF697 family)